MKLHIFICFCALALTVAFTVSPVQADVSEPYNPYHKLTAPVNDPVQRMFAEDRITFGVASGALFSESGIGPEVPDFNYIPVNFRIGWMVNEVNYDLGPLSGNFELMLELNVSAIYDGFGDIIIGPTALLRYNFVQPNWKVVPFFQIGAGVVYTDAYQDRTQDAIGQAIEFTPQASVGSRFIINDNWTFDAEFQYHHISNASMSPRNDGTNAIGGLVGATYFFDKPWK